MQPLSSNTECLVGEVTDGLKTGMLPVRVFDDEDIFSDELERIFMRAWVYIGHESEIPANGDYVQRSIAGDAFILVRGEDGVVRVLFDSCRHRGAIVCRSDKGNASHFRCPYHGWTYKNTGEMAGAPFFRPAYGDALRREEWGLHQAPRVDSLHGFVFASLDPGAPTLDEYLGSMRWYFDLIWGSCTDGWEVLGDPQRFQVSADWKAGADNFSGDDYHTFYLHRSAVETEVMPHPGGGGGFEEYMRGHHVQCGNGHALSCTLLPPEAEGFHLGYGEEFPNLFSAQNVPQSVYEASGRLCGTVGTVFPNFSFLSFSMTQTPNKPATSAMTVRVWQPAGAGKLEVWTWIMCPKGVSEEFRDRSYRATMGTFSASGVLEQDDGEPWIAMSKTARSSFARKNDLMLNYQMGLTGAGISKRDENFPGPGVAYYPILEEGVHRGFHRRWAQFMRADEFPPAMTAEEQDGEVELTADSAQ